MCCLKRESGEKTTESLYALFPIAVYGLIHILANEIPFDAKTGSLVLLCLETVFWGIFFFLCSKRGALRRCRLCLPERVRPAELLLLAIPCAQVCVYGFPDTFRFSLISGALAEELLFRAWLPACLKKKYGCSATARAAISSGLFGLFHLVGRFSAGAPLGGILLSVYAFCAGSALFAVAERENSILYCFLLHLLLNCTAPPVQGLAPRTAGMTVLFSAVFLLYAILSSVHCKKERKTGNESVH